MRRGYRLDGHRRRVRAAIEESFDLDVGRGWRTLWPFAEQEPGGVLGRVAVGFVAHTNSERRRAIA
jgi:hypothetical protein